MKSLHTRILICLLSLGVGVTLTSSIIAFAEVPNKILVPREGLLPLGSLSTENPALFDVVSEPVQSITQSSHPVLISIIVGVFIAIFVLLLIKFRKQYGQKEKKKEEMNTTVTQKIPEPER